MQIEVHLSFSTDVLPKMISVISCYQMKTFFVVTVTLLPKNQGDMDQTRRV